MLCKKTYKNQITLPKKIVEQFGDFEYLKVGIEDEQIILTPVEMEPIVSLTRIRKKIFALGLTEQDIEEAIRWARKK
ncbi:MAG: AbrB/MazE/SpoVT family DNA-binding domain-containing protein [Candidatus Omnitrophota bacterium]